MPSPTYLSFNQAGLSAGGACLFKNASIGCTVLPADTQDSSECALLKLFKSFDVAMVRYSCFTAIQKCGQHDSFAFIYQDLSRCPISSSSVKTKVFSLT